MLNVLQARWILKFKRNYSLFCKSITYEHLQVF